MLNNIVQPIEEQLLQVHNKIKKELVIKAGHVGTFAHLDFSSVNKTIRPALAILSSRLFGGNQKKTIALASVFQFIYMASRVHNGITESDSDYLRGDSDPRDGSQFPVLVGDYLYGKFFTLLCDAGIINLLQPVAEIICDIHEGGILKKKAAGQDHSSQSWREVVRKETAELFAGCCFLSARLAGAPEEQQEVMRHFGLNLGMAFGLMEKGVSFDTVEGYIEKAKKELAAMPDRPERGILRRMVNSLGEHGLPAVRMVG
ncbi:MAG: polyprenyl synthetase family protein [Firmicutes bacterium]|nr:polyprenyl synthetase family protein [Bacillota bacterium]